MSKNSNTTQKKKLSKKKSSVKSNKDNTNGYHIFKNIKLNIDEKKIPKCKYFFQKFEKIQNDYIENNTDNNNFKKLIDKSSAKVKSPSGTSFVGFDIGRSKIRNNTVIGFLNVSSWYSRPYRNFKEKTKRFNILYFYEIPQNINLQLIIAKKEKKTKKALNIFKYTSSSYVKKKNYKYK